MLQGRWLAPGEKEKSCRALEEKEGDGGSDNRREERASARRVIEKRYAFQKKRKFLT